MQKKQKKSAKKPLKEIFISLGIVALVLAIPLAIVVSQQDTNTASHAATFTCSKSNATGATTTTIFTASGATPDDTTDDYTAIQTAITNASNAGGGIVSLPAGTFIINGHLQMKNNVTLQGTGSATIIKAGPTFMSATGPFGGYPLITTNGASNVTITSLTADQSGDTLSGNVGNRLDEYLIDIRNSTNVIVDSVSTRNPFTYSIVAVGSTNFCIKNSNTQVATSGKYNQLDGIHVLNSSFGDVINNTIDQRIGTDGDDGLVAHTIGGSVHDITYAGNKVRGGNNGNGMQLALTHASDSIYNITIQNNEFYDSPYGIRTGYYGDGAGSVHDITVTANNIHDIRGGNAFPNGEGNAVGIGYDAPAGTVFTNIVVTNNQTCNAGIILMTPGTGNIYSNNIDCKTPTATPTNSPLPTNTPIPTATPVKDTIAPNVSITSPLNKSTVSRNKTITISASASDNVGIAKVQFFINGSLLCTDTSYPYACSWKVPSAWAKTYTIKVTAYDAASNTSSSSVNVTAR